MPALSGSLRYARFFVEAELPRDFVASSYDAIRVRAMRPLSATEPEAERSGWCVMGDPLDVELARERIYKDGFLNLGLRTDRWAIPGPLLRTKVREAEASLLAQRGQERLGRRDKAEVKERVTLELRKKLVPSTRSIDLSWSLEEGVVRFFSHAEKARHTMLDLFKKTFGIELVGESPYTLGARLGLTAEQLRVWESLEPTDLTREGAR